MKTRREFIKTTSTFAVLSMLPPLAIDTMSKNKYIGIQLYTIRKKLNENFLSTMQHIAKIGFNAIETAGYNDRKFYGYKPKDFKTFTDDLGLKALSSHSKIQLNNLNQIIEDTLEAGMEYLVKSWISNDKRKSIDDYKRLAEEFNVIGEKCMKAGLHFAYHNHAFEFESIEGVIPYDILLINTEKDFVTMELDTYWMVYGGYDPIDYFNKYPGRFELLHIKDMDKTDKQETIEIGNGSINFSEIFKMDNISGMKYFFLEQESFKMNEFESLSISYEYLKNI